MELLQDSSLVLSPLLALGCMSTAVVGCFHDGVALLFEAVPDEEG